MKAKLALVAIAAATMGVPARANADNVSGRMIPSRSPCHLAPIMRLPGLGATCSKCGKAIK